MLLMDGPPVGWQAFVLVLVLVVVLDSFQPTPSPSMDQEIARMSKKLPFS